MKFCIPFHIKNEPIRRLAVINVLGSNEFDGFEPQFFDDDINGKGIRLLRYRKDGRVDIYYEESLIFDDSISVGSGIGDLMKVSFSIKLFEITQNGLQLELEFTDAQGRLNQLIVRENSNGKTPVPFLAPVGGDVKDPKKMFFVYMNSFDMVYRHGTKFGGKIGEEVLQPAKLPILINRHRILLARYCEGVNILALNTINEKPFVFHAEAGHTIQLGNCELVINQDGRIEKIINKNEAFLNELLFPEGLPNLFEMDDKSRVTGCMELFMCSSKITSARYVLTRNKEAVDVKLSQFERWESGKYQLGYELLLRLVSVFRNWPTFYTYTGKVNLDTEMLEDGHWDNLRKRV